MAVKGPVERFHESVNDWCKPFETYSKTPFLGAIPAVGAVGLRCLSLIVSLVDLVYSLITAACACKIEPLKKSASNLGHSVFFVFGDSTFAIPGYGAWQNTTKNQETNVEDRLEKPKGFNPLWLFNAIGKVVWGVIHFALNAFVLIVTFGYFRSDNFKEMKRGVQVMAAGALDMVPFVKGEDWVGRA